MEIVYGNLLTLNIYEVMCGEESADVDIIKYKFVWTESGFFIQDDKLDYTLCLVSTLF